MLTETMRRALFLVETGAIENRAGKWINIDDPSETVRPQTLQALKDRKLIVDRGFSGATYHVNLWLTQAGKDLLYPPNNKVNHQE